MTALPTNLEKDTKKQEHLKKSSTKTWLRWLNFMFVFITASVICYFKYFTEQDAKIIKDTGFATKNTHTVNHLEINVEEYERLGLTPVKPVEIVSLTAGGHNHRKQTIHGRFLHITDIHPDPYYTEGHDIENACHKGKPQDGAQGASKYGDALLGCDSPLILMNETLEWIRTNLRDKIDFVIWTGDNVRHDNDRKIQRTEMEIFDLNRDVSIAFHDIFHGEELDPRHYDVPVVPSLGNNDVYPHNLFAPGPTLQTREMWTIWQSFVPEEQLHIFERGAYFFNEVIPNKLAVLSINTLYLFKSNPLVDSCDKKKDPGYKLFTWLGVTLEELRQRKMKVWLSGHVPPVPKNFDITCYRKFAIWLHEYRDVIIGGVYGHMNVDHFIPVDSQQAYKSYSDSLIAQGHELQNSQLDVQQKYDDVSKDLDDVYLGFGFNVSEHDLNVAIASNFAHTLGGKPTNKESYMNDVRSLVYADVRKAASSGEHAERYSIVNVAASVIPTFNPGFRVWEYNITGIEDDFQLERQPWTDFFKDLDREIFDDDEDDEDFEDFAHIARKGKKKKGKKGRKGKKPKKDPSLPEKKPTTAPLGPGYTPQLFSPTKFVQYYLDLEAVNKGEKPFEYEVEYKSGDSPLNLKGLLVEDYIQLARDLGKPLKSKPSEIETEIEVEAEGAIDVDTSKGKGKKQKGKKEKGNKLEDLWAKYVEYAFVSSGYHD